MATNISLIWLDSFARISPQFHVGEAGTPCMHACMHTKNVFFPIFAREDGGAQPVLTGVHPGSYLGYASQHEHQNEEGGATYFAKTLSDGRASPSKMLFALSSRLPHARARLLQRGDTLSLSLLSLGPTRMLVQDRHSKHSRLLCESCRACPAPAVHQHFLGSTLLSMFPEKSRTRNRS